MPDVLPAAVFRYIPSKSIRGMALFHLAGRECFGQGGLNDQLLRVECLVPLEQIVHGGIDAAVPGDRRRGGVVQLAELVVPYRSPHALFPRTVIDECAAHSHWLKDLLFQEIAEALS